MSLWSDIFFDFIEGIFSVDDDDPFNGLDRPYYGHGFMSDYEYREYVQAQNANLMCGAFNHRTRMFDDGSDPAGDYDDDDWEPGHFGTCDDD